MGWIDPGLVIGGLLGGFTMGLTGMGGGALLTPMLVLVFGVSPTAAVGSDLVTSLAVKPFGGAIHAAVMVWRARNPVPDHVGPPTPVRPIPTVALGLIGGTVVGLTSVGSGSLMIAVLTLLYPKLKRSELVGTDLVQAVPLVGAAALAHMSIGSVSAAITGSLILGSLPDIILGARASAHYLGASALKLLGVL